MAKTAAKWKSTSSTTDINYTYKYVDEIKSNFEKAVKESAKRKKKLCRNCANVYYVDEGVSGDYCSLDCKYRMCVIEEETDEV